MSMPKDMMLAMRQVRMMEPVGVDVITNMTNQIIILQTRLMNMKQVMKMDIRMATMQNVMMMTESL